MSWDDRYKSGEKINDAPHPLVITYASVLRAAKALDLASGPGRHSIWLAERGWRITAVDSSQVAIEILRRRAMERGLRIDARVADLERQEFVIEPSSYDLIVVCNYLQRDLFPAIRAGVRIGGILIAIGPLVDEDPMVKPMNPAYLLNPGELSSEFEGWELIHNFEGKPAGNAQRRATAEFVARRLR